MNPKYGHGNMKGFNTDIGIAVSLAKYRFINFNLEKARKQFKEDLFYMAKVLKGQYFVKQDDNSNLLFNEGDIFCFMGNYSINPKFYFDQDTSILGVFGYRSDIINAFTKKAWFTDRIEKILNDEDLKNGIVITKTYELEKDFESLYNAIEDDDRFSAYTKIVNIFQYFITNYDKSIYTKSKTYAEAQVDTVIKIKSFLDNNLNQYYPMPKIAEMFNISLSRMQSIFMDYYKLSPYRYHLNARLERANYLILNTDMKIGDIAKSVGFNSYNKFVKAYKTKYDCNPSKHRTN
ncbi:MAG: AraC family transcriptional regulator [Tissierellia bacterium]|nr:AraC family transcriptional regulator [Tissierellia bacterium]